MTPQYFFDVLQEWEIREYIDTIKYFDIPEWERTRLIMYMTAQVNCSKELKLQDVFKFKWDDEYNSNNIITKNNIKIGYPTSVNILSNEDNLNEEI